MPPETRFDPDARLSLRPTGLIRTPYLCQAPCQPVPDATGDFRFHPRSALPPWTAMVRDLPASLSLPLPSPVAAEITDLGDPAVGVRGNEIRTSGLDAFDGTPLVDLELHVEAVHAKEDAPFSSPAHAARRSLSCISPGYAHARQAGPTHRDDLALVVTEGGTGWNHSIPHRKWRSTA